MWKLIISLSIMILKLLSIVLVGRLFKMFNGDIFSMCTQKNYRLLSRTARKQCTPNHPPLPPIPTHTHA